MQNSPALWTQFPKLKLREPISAVNSLLENGVWGLAIPLGTGANTEEGGNRTPCRRCSPAFFLSMVSFEQCLFTAPLCQAGVWEGPAHGPTASLVKDPCGSLAGNRWPIFHIPRSRSACASIKSKWPSQAGSRIRS